MVEKLCIDCRHFQPPASESQLGMDYGKCTAITIKSPVDGIETHAYVATARLFEHVGCGPDGLKWEKKQ